MKIVSESLEPFLEEITREAANVWRKQVRFSAVPVPEQQERISFRVWLMLTALIDTGEDGQYIVQAEIDCGSDDPDVDPKNRGTQKSLRMMKEVHEVAKRCKLVVLQGKMLE